MPGRTRRPRTFTHSHLQRLTRGAEHYLPYCYRLQTAVRGSEFAAFLGVTHAYLSTIVPQITGKSLRVFLLEKQLATAEFLLLNTPLLIEQIARRCGFGTIATFYRCFQAAYGMPPGRFRELKK